MVPGGGGSSATVPHAAADRPASKHCTVFTRRHLVHAVADEHHLRGCSTALASQNPGQKGDLWGLVSMGQVA